MSQPCLSYLSNLLRWYHLPCRLIGGPTLTPITPGLHRQLGTREAHIKCAVFKGLWACLTLNSLLSVPCSLNSITSEETKRHSVKSMGSDSSSSGQGSLLTVDIKNFKALWNEEVYQNRERWKAQACKGT